MAFDPKRTEPVAKVVTEKRRRLWTAIADFVHAAGGWVTSPPFGRFIRIEVKQGSSLPTQLEKAGHPLRHAGMTTRIDAGDFTTVDVLELDLGR